MLRAGRSRRSVGWGRSCVRWDNNRCTARACDGRSVPLATPRPRSGDSQPPRPLGFVPSSLRDSICLTQSIQLRLGRADLCHHRVSAHAQTGCTARKPLHFARPAQPASMSGAHARCVALARVFQPTHLSFPNSRLAAPVPVVVARSERECNRAQLVALTIQITAQSHTQLPRIYPVVLPFALQFSASVWSPANGLPRTELLVQGITNPQLSYTVCTASPRALFSFTTGAVARGSTSPLARIDTAPALHRHRHRPQLDV